MATVTGGTALSAHLRKMRTRLTKASEVRVGFLEGATYPDGTSVAMVAAIQNFGAPEAGIPARPFFSNMIADKSPDWGGKFAKILTLNEYDAEHALSVMGEGIAGQLRESVIDTNDPPLSPRTIARKGSAKPLVDTGHMLGSIDKEVS